jgi:hypothetical protein
MEDQRIYRVVILLLISVIFQVTQAQSEARIDSDRFVKSVEAESITISELRDHLFYLASDSMKGRKTGSSEYLLAAAYCAEKLSESGIEPLDPKIDEIAAFYQDVPYKSINYSRGRYPIILADEKGLRYADGLNFSVNITEGSQSGNNTLKVVFVGYGVSAPEYGWDDFSGLNLEGKAVLVLNQKPPEELINKIPLKKREKLLNYRQNISDRKASVIIEISEAEWILKNLGYSPGLKTQVFFVNNGIESHRNKYSPLSSLYIRNDIVDPVFKGQPFNPTKRIIAVNNEYRTFELKGVRLDTSDFTNERQVFSPNVVGVVKGSDPGLAQQYVVIGAHLDHIGTVFNGADDNASGSAGVLEIAEAIAMNPPKRSVVFVLFSGEEMSFLGSAYFVNNCPVPMDSIIGMINLDMIGRTEEKYKNEGTHYICNMRGASDYMLGFVEEINRKTYRWPLMRLTESGSDHANFARRGIPSVSFYSGHQKDLHATEDDPQNIEYNKMLILTRLTYEVVVQLANNGMTLDETLDAKEGLL